MTTLDKLSRDQQMEDMASFDEEMPSVGIFWYDTRGTHISHRRDFPSPIF